LIVESLLSPNGRPPLGAPHGFQGRRIIPPGQEANVSDRIGSQFFGFILGSFMSFLFFLFFCGH
jgi:hypothetical protein